MASGCQFVCYGSRPKHLRKELHTILKRLQERDAAEWRQDERFDHYENALTDIVEKASRKVVEYARQFTKPVLVMEDLTHIREELDYSAYLNRRLHAWAFARLQRRIKDKAREAGIPVESVRPEYTSQFYHACGNIGERTTQAVFRCVNGECHVSGFQADINAAANIARRVDPWGESLPLKPAGDDSPRDGSARDSTATRSEQRPSRQMTVGELGWISLPARSRYSPVGKPRRSRCGGCHRYPMSEISVGVSDDVAILVEQLDPDEIQRIVGSARRERASEERMDDFADEQLAMSELDDDTTRVLAAVVQERALARHRSEQVP